MNNALFYETSAKNDRIIDDVFQELSNNQHIIKNITNNDDETDDNIYKLVIPKRNNSCCR